jgi:LPXTG-motif cell wall-anchored protein
MTSLRAEFGALVVSLAAGLLTMTGIAFAQTGTSTATSTTTLSGTTLGITLNATPRVAQGQDALLALAILTAGSNDSIQFSSLPVSATFGGGLAPSHTSDCRIRNVMSLATPLNSSATGLSSGTNTFSFSSVTVGAGSTVTLAITCDIASDAPSGGTIALSLTPSAVSASVSGGGTSVTPIVGPNVNGGTGPTAGTTTITPGAVPPMIPGVPNTGTGTYAVVLALAALTGLGALMLLRRRFV